MRWRWRRLLLIPVLASLHACDCGSCLTLGDGDSSGCAPGPTSCGLATCGIGGQCALEGGTCPANMQLDTTSTCDDAGTYCCALLPPCALLGGTCTAVPGGSSCTNGSLQGDCEDSGVCCAMPIDGGSLGVPEDAQAADAPEDASPLGSCNAMPCASECICEPSGTDAGGGVCDCGMTEAGVDAESEADSGGGADAQLQDATVDAVAIDGPAPDAYSAVEASASGDATMDGGAADAADADAAADAAGDAAGSCGVILCASTCACVSPQTSACVCP